MYVWQILVFFFLCHLQAVCLRASPVTSLPQFPVVNHDHEDKLGMLRGVGVAASGAPRSAARKSSRGVRSWFSLGGGRRGKWPQICNLKT